MRRIETIADISKVNDLKDFLNDLDIEEMIISETREYERYKEQAYVWRRGEYKLENTPKIRIEFFVESGKEEQLMERLQDAAYTGAIGGVVSSPCHFHLIGQEYSEPVSTADPENIRVNGITDLFTFYWKATGSSDSDVRTVSISFEDSPDILSKIAGVFTLNGFDILNAKKYMQNNDALNIFKIRRPSSGDGLEGQDMEQGLDNVKEDLKSAFSDESEWSAKLYEKILAYRSLTPFVSGGTRQTVVDNDSSDVYSVIKVTMHDFPGLLFSVTDALFKCGLDIRMAKISTKANLVEDVFYVKDFQGKKVESPDQVLAIKTAINKSLAATDPQILMN